MALFDFGVGTALLVSFVSVGLYFFGWFVLQFKFLRDFLRVLFLPVFLFNVVLWSFVFFTGFLSFPLFWIVGVLVVVIYFEYKRNVVSNLLSRRGGR